MSGNLLLPPIKETIYVLVRYSTWETYLDLLKCGCAAKRLQLLKHIGHRRVVYRLSAAQTREFCARESRTPLLMTAFWSLPTNSFDEPLGGMIGSRFRTLDQVRGDPVKTR